MYINVPLGIIAMLISLLAMILLVIASAKIGGIVGKIFKFLVAGIFFSVTIHSILELLSQFNILPMGPIMSAMSISITIGAIFFIIAGILAIRKFKT